MKADAGYRSLWAICHRCGHAGYRFPCGLCGECCVDSPVAHLHGQEDEDGQEDDVDAGRPLSQRQRRQRLRSVPDGPCAVCGGYPEDHGPGGLVEHDWIPLGPV